jgi:RNA polymerase primary sigma factor
MSKLDKKKEFQKLITLGKEKGFLTYEEINDALPEDITESEDLDEIMALIEENDIEIVENEKQLKASGGKKGEKGATSAAAASDTDAAAPAKPETEEEGLARGLDPVRLYLKKMGSVALLTREGEIEIAKRIEEGEAEVLDVILNSSMGIKEFLAIGEKIEKGKLRARDVVRGGETEAESTEEGGEEKEGVEGAEGAAPGVEGAEVAVAAPVAPAPGPTHGGHGHHGGPGAPGQPTAEMQGLNEQECRDRILDGMKLVKNFEKIVNAVEQKLLKGGQAATERKKLREKLASNRRSIVKVFQEINFNRKTINKIVAKFKTQVQRIEEAESEINHSLRKIHCDGIGKFRKFLKEAKRNKKFEEQLKSKYGVDYTGLLEIDHIITNAGKKVAVVEKEANLRARELKDMYEAILAGERKSEIAKAELVEANLRRSRRSTRTADCSSWISSRKATSVS